MRELSRNELILIRGALYTKRMYRGAKHIPHGAVIWEEWMEDSCLLYTSDAADE